MKKIRQKTTKREKKGGIIIWSCELPSFALFGGKVYSFPFLSVLDIYF